MTAQPTHLSDYRAQRKHRRREAEARQAKTILDKAHVRAKHILEDATREAKQQAKQIIIQAEQRASLVTEQAYNLGLAKADARVLANERRRAAAAKQKRTNK